MKSNLNNFTDTHFKQVGALLLLTSGILMTLIAPLYKRGMESIQQLGFILVSGGLTAAKFEVSGKSISISQTYPNCPPDPNQYPTEYLQGQYPNQQQPNYPPNQYPTEYQRYGNPNQVNERSVIVKEGDSYKGEY
jgi:hypothetical protein